jgi:hypothetical protein
VKTSHAFMIWNLAAEAHSEAPIIWPKGISANKKRRFTDEVLGRLRNQTVAYVADGIAGLAKGAGAATPVSDQ